MTNSKELWNDHRTASANAVAILRRLEAEGHLNPTAAHSVRKQLRILDGIAEAIGEASIREAKELTAKRDRAAQLTEAIANLEDDEDEDCYLANLGASQ